MKQVIIGCLSGLAAVILVLVLVKVFSPVRPLPVEDVTGMELVFVKGGTFTMGCTAEQGDDCSDNERPAHQVTVGDFYIGKYEVTQAQWRSVMGDNPSYFRRDDLPVECVSWDDVQIFIRRLKTKTGKNYRLPTEAEWEYAARGGARSKGYKYSGSEDIDKVAWFLENSKHTTHPVGIKKANELGICDMSGNVREWTSDYYSESRMSPLRVIRGGSWLDDAWSARVSFRHGFTPSDRGSFLGFRLALSSR